MKDDSTQLPYVSATIMEIQRLSVTAPVSLPHKFMADVEIAGYVIPKGSSVVANIRNFMHDPNVFDDPQSFKPERFLESDGKTIKKYDQFVPFGIGKRFCMGDSLAKHEIFIFFVMMIQRIKFGPSEVFGKPDKNHCTMGFTAIPKPFHVKVEKR